MPHQVEWDDETRHTVCVTVCVTVSGRWRWSDLYQAQDALHTLLDENGVTADVIFVLLAAFWIPPDFKTHIGQLSAVVHPLINLVIVVARWPLFADLAVLFLRLRGQPYDYLRYAPSLEAARQMIEAQRQQF